MLDAGCWMLDAARRRLEAMADGGCCASTALSVKMLPAVVLSYGGRGMPGP